MITCSVPVFFICVALAQSGCSRNSAVLVNPEPESAEIVVAFKPPLAMPLEANPMISDDKRLSDFVRRIFHDSHGNLWFGTNGDGVIRHDGDSLEMFSVEQGFGGVAVRGIAEDKAGNVWFGTEAGLTKYDGKSFTKFTEREGLAHNDVWALTIDRHGEMWVGTLQG
ncbi:MAG: ligand-binding sensor domain-containing protein, partial [Mariniblastus sp.]